MIQAMLTTTDNPYDPFDDFVNWYAYDTRMGYNTASFLARVTITSSEISETDQYLAIETAIDEIVEENILGIYKKLTREV